MKSPKAPAAPDPKETAAAQTQTNVSTALANAYLGNVNQVTPDGSLTFAKTGNNFIEDSTSGTTFWRNAAGDIQSSRPMLSGTPATSETKWVTDPKTGMLKQQTVTSGGGKYDPSYVAVKGYNAPTFTATQTLSQMQQAIKDQEDQTNLNLGRTANQQSQRIGELLNTSLDVSKLPAAGTVPTYTRFGAGPQLATTFDDAGPITRTYGDAGGYEAARKTVEDGLYARLNPQIDRQRNDLETTLANKGFVVGSKAYQNAMDDFNRGLNDQRTSITLAGGQEQSRLAGLDQARATFQNSAQAQDFDQKYTRAGFSNAALQQMFGNDLAVTAANNELSDRTFNNQNTARSNALTEATALRQMPINEISALLSGAQVNQPQFVKTNMPTIPTTDYAGMVQQNYSNALQAWQTKVNSQNSALGAVGGLAGTALGGWARSDRRVKTDIRLIGDTGRGFALYAFSYRDEPGRQVGYMADEVERVHPEAVAEFGGVKHVNYAMLEAA